MVRVESVRVLPDHHLLLTFTTGERRRFDMRPYLQYPVFRKLATPGLFARARVAYGTVVWPGDIDIAPETLFDRSVPVEEGTRSEPKTATL